MMAPANTEATYEQLLAAIMQFREAHSMNQADNAPEEKADHDQQ